MRKKILLSLAAVLIVGGVAAWVLTRPEPPDTRFNGAYLLEDGTQVFIVPREGKQLRWRLVNGDTGVLWPTENDAYEGGPGWDHRQPVVNRVRFDMTADGRARGFEWQRGDGDRHRARKIALPERIVAFPSGDLMLRGKLVLPEGAGPFPAVVVVHGSEAYSAVDHYFNPYLYAANGIATLVFDKRGTGGSEGKYLQNFSILAGDVIAAVRWLRTQDQIDARRIHLAGFSQGGWIAPLAALEDGGIRSVLVGYGVMLPVTAEDRWGYVYALQRKGLGADAIVAADRVNALIEDIVDRRLDRWGELDEMLDASRCEPWFEAVRGSDSMLGMVTDAKMPLWMMRMYLWWTTRGDVPFIDRLYHPVPTMQKLATPSLWLLAGKDHSAPTEWTIDELRKLEEAGQPVELVIYPDADHGIMTFTEGEDGTREYIGYDPDFLPRQLQWLREQSGLPAASSE